MEFKYGRKAKDLFCVCYAGDDNYTEQLGVSIYSLCENNRDLESLDLFLFSYGISDENLAKLSSVADRFGRVMKVVDVREKVDGLRRFDINSNVENASYAIYGRLFIPDSIPSGYTAALYLDADTIVAGSLRELAESIPETPLSAVIDIIPSEYKKLIGLDGPYYNGGVFLMNPARWKSDGCTRKILDFISGIDRQYRHSEQDYINLALKGFISTLPLKYNHFPFYGEIPYSDLRIFLGKENDYYREEEYEEAQKAPVIIHLVNSVLDRPWYRHNLNPYTDLWKSYAAKAGWPDPKILERDPFGSIWRKQVLYRLFGTGAVVRLEAARNRKRYLKK